MGDRRSHRDGQGGAEGVPPGLSDAARAGRNPPVVYRRSEATPVKPRRVSGGIRLPSGPVDESKAWISQRWMRPVESVAHPDQLAEGLEYARLGQTRSMDITRGRVSARVQGRRPEAYVVQIRLQTFASEQWDEAMSHLLSQARYLAMLLSGELSQNIEDAFAPVGLRLFPTEPQDLAVSCTCGERGPWCKHACCVMRLVAARLTTDPLLIFRMRGLEEADLLERVRRQRAMGATGSSPAATPVYTPHLPGVADEPSSDLESSLTTFWRAGTELDRIELPIETPPVSHPLLRRLGPSPFRSAKFPLVGLLATCYDVIGDSVLHGDEDAAADTDHELDRG